MPTPEHRSDLIRLHTAASELRMTTDGDKTRFSGYAAVFNSPTVIKSWEGHFTERFLPGAFKKTLTETGDQVRFLYDHGLDPSIGNKPLGKIDRLYEDDKGLRVEATLIDRPYVDDIAEALRAEALDGMSFRFSVVRDEWDEAKSPPERTVKEAKLHEVSVVTFPAYAATTAGVRGQDAYVAWRAATDTKNASFYNGQSWSNAARLSENISVSYGPEVSISAAADSGTAPTEAADSGTSDAKRIDRAEFLEHVRSALTRSKTNA